MEFLIQKKRKRVELFLVGRKPMHGSVFLDENCKAHHGAERVQDVLTGNTPFLPFLGDDGAFLLVQIASIQKVVVDAEYELEIVQSYGITAEIGQDVSVFMTDGSEEKGKLVVEPREGASRPRDELNRSKGFVALICGISVHLLGLRYIAAVQESGAT